MEMLILHMLPSNARLDYLSWDVRVRVKLMSLKNDRLKQMVTSYHFPPSVFIIVFIFIRSSLLSRFSRFFLPILIRSSVPYRIIIL